jgi:hypothetical protein
MYRSRDTTHALSPAWSGRTTPRRRRFLSALAPTLVGALIASVLTYAAVPRAAKHDVCPSVAPVILRTYEPAPPALSIEERIPAQVPLPVVMEEKPVPVAEPVQNATAWSKALKGAPTPQFRGEFETPLRFLHSTELHISRQPASRQAVHHNLSRRWLEYVPPRSDVPSASDE